VRGDAVDRGDAAAPPPKLLDACSSGLPPTTLCPKLVWMLSAFVVVGALRISGLPPLVGPTGLLPLLL
jgi:hypothetical protein